MMRRRLLAWVSSVVLALALVPGIGNADEHRDDPIELSVYLLLDQFESGPYLVPVAREVDGTVGVAEAAVTALLDGPTDAEAVSLPGVRSGIPDGVTLNGIAITDGLATVDLSGGFEQGGGSFAMLSRLAQLVFTVTQFPTVDAVALEIDGDPVTVFSGEGLDVTPPVDRGWFDGTGVIPPVFVDTPAYGGASDARLTGTTTVDVFDVKILDGDGRPLGEAQVSVETATEGPFFDVTVPYVALEEMFGIVLVEDPDDAAGSLREYPVTLAPTPVATARGIAAACPPIEVPDAEFADVAGTNVHAAAIDCLAWRAITAGRTTDAFEPGGVITRGQMATMLVNTLRTVGVALPDDPASTFSDVAGTTHATQIDQLAELGIVAGAGDGTYRPSAPVTRAQMSTLLVGTFEHAASFELDPRRDYFIDDDEHVHEPSIDAAALAGLTAGTDGDRFSPGAELRRDQMATFVTRLLDALVVEAGAVISE